MDSPTSELLIGIQRLAFNVAAYLQRVIPAGRRAAGRAEEVVVDAGPSDSTVVIASEFMGLMGFCGGECLDSDSLSQDMNLRRQVTHQIS